MLIDGHAHGYHGKHFDKLSEVGGEWAKKAIDRELKRAEDRPEYLDVARAVERLDRLGYDMQVVTPLIFIDINRHPGGIETKVAMARAINDNMARYMEESKGRMVTIGTVPPDGMEQGGREEMERAIGLGLKGFNLPTNINGRPLDAPEFEAFWAQVNAMDVPVYSHPVEPLEQPPYEKDFWLTVTLGWPFETSLMLCRLVFSGVMERYPNLNIVAHHLGGGLVPFYWGRINEVYDRTAVIAGLHRAQDLIADLPKPLFDYFSRFYYDTSVLGTNALKCTYEVFGAGRMLFGTDNPFGPERGERRMREYPDQIRALGLSEEETEQIFSGNAKELLKL